MKAYKTKNMAHGSWSETYQTKRFEKWGQNNFARIMVLHDLPKNPNITNVSEQNALPFSCT